MFSNRLLRVFFKKRRSSAAEPAPELILCFIAEEGTGCSAGKLAVLSYVSTPPIRINYNLVIVNSNGRGRNIGRALKKEILITRSSEAAAAY
ncbi:MAG: hypothetical protein ACT6RN_28035, partial [Agrobacterium sp.]|uniref:hypothetical protein n=1 Tax=Agrobacterium sp. TaxID=361 RepID=UPI004037614D